MNDADPLSVTALLHAAQGGDARAFDQVYEQVYQELRRLAHVVRQGRAGATLNTTALVHEAYLKLLPSQDLAWESRAHFFGVAARAMRQVLVSAARERQADKRTPAAFTVQLDEGLHAAPVAPEDVLALDDALQDLASFAPRQAHVIECRFFAGLTVEETAQALGIGTATVKRDWRTARAWLTHQLAR